MELQPQRRRSNTTSSSSSPEFEFWMVRNPSLPSQHLLTADELIVDGVLLPLHLLSLRPSPPLHPRASSPSPTSSIIPSTPTSSSRRWKDLFKAVGEAKAEDKERKKEHNINLKIWPFSRSRSSGNTATRPRSVSRKISSAPCSRSNSRGESPGGRRWAASPGRTGVHLGRSSPVWQFRRTGMGFKEKVRKYGATPVNNGGGVRVLNLSVNSCIGYRNPVSCRDDESDGLAGGGRAAERNGDNGAAFRFRALFSKKVF